MQDISGNRDKTMNDLNLPLSKCRAEFPLLSQKIRGKNLVYLDSAATSLKPWPVIERVGHFLTYQTANVHRGAHFLANQATEHYEQARQKVADFINAKSKESIVFTRGTTESINLIAQSWGIQNLQKDDVILLSEMEHHSNIVPWQLVAEKVGANIEVLPISDEGEISIENLSQHLHAKVKILSVAHVSNTLGTINPIKKIIELAHEKKILVCVDGAQRAPTGPIDVQDLDADFYVFSGHKVFAPFGIGVMYAREEILQSMPPYQGGGSMISEVTFQKTTFHDIPYRFEAGTPNVEGAVGLATALEYTERLGWENIHRHEESLLIAATEALKTIEGVKIFGTSKNKIALISFIIEGTHPSDIGQILDQENVAVRVGHHCTQPLMQKFNIPGTVRASFSIYNSMNDIEKMILALKKAKEMLL